MTTVPPVYPFDAVVGQDDAKLALLVARVDPLVGGVLLRGDKGSAKTTLARGLASLMGPEVPFVELPLGATEDRVIGSLDLRATLTDGITRFAPGLLAAAHGGVLYVDEVNLLADHLVDVLLDVAVSGVNRVERDGVSHSHPARFVLVGSMNPEEGELRPQLLDRFGLCVDVTAPGDPAQRAEIVRRRLRHDAGADAVTVAGSGAGGNGAGGWDRSSAARPARVGDDLIDAACRLALAVGVQGLRADLVLCRASAACAGLEGRREATVEDLRRVAPFVLTHRRRRHPFDPPGLPPEELERAFDDALSQASGTEPEPEHELEPSPPPPPDGGDPSDADGAADGAPRGTAPPRPLVLGAERPAALIPSPSAVESRRGRHVRDVAFDGTRPVATVATIRHIAARRDGNPEAEVQGEDVRASLRREAAGTLVIMVLDASGSMGTGHRVEAATGAILGLLTRAYQRRDQVALISVAGDGAEVVVPPTASVEIARRRLEGLSTGGPTPLGAGLSRARTLAAGAAGGRTPMVVVLTDGRATGSPTAMDDALDAAAALGRAGITGVVVDCEPHGGPRLGLARTLADAMGARYVPPDGFPTGDGLRRRVEEAVGS